MKIPNFDDKDLAIAGIVLISIVGFVVGWSKGIDAAVLYAFGGGCVTGIAGLATGRKRDPAAQRDGAEREKNE